MLRNKKGSILFLVYGIILVLLLLSAGVFTHSVQEKRAFDITKQRTDAFYAAEAGMDSALAGLKANVNYSGTGTSSPVAVLRDTLTVGEYETTIVDLGNSLKKITVTGYAPQKTVVAGILRQTCGIEGVARVSNLGPPSNFYDYAIYASGDVSPSGNNDVIGDIIYGGTIGSFSPGTVTGSSSPGAVSPLPAFDFQSMHDAAVSQGNLYDAARLASGSAFPADFWYTPPNSSAPPGTLAYFGTPNVVYVEGDMSISGNTTIGGFFLVVGNVLTDPTVQSNTSITGAMTVEGCIYSTGDFVLKGGGGPNVLNVNGGIWAGENATLRGNVEVEYESDYMDAVEYFVNNYSNVTVQLLSWRQLDLYN